MEILVSLQSLLQQLDLLVTLNAPSLGIRTALPIAFILVQADHLLDTCLVLFFDTKLEFELGQHELDLGSEVRSVIFNQVYNITRLSVNAIHM